MQKQCPLVGVWADSDKVITPIMAERLFVQVTGGRLLVSITVETVQPLAP